MSSISDLSSKNNCHSFLSTTTQWVSFHQLIIIIKLKNYSQTRLNRTLNKPESCINQNPE